MSPAPPAGVRTRNLLAAGLCLVPAVLLIGFETLRSRDEIASAYRGLSGLEAMRPVIALAAPLAAGDDAKALALFQAVDAARLGRDQQFGTDAHSRALGNTVRNGNPANPRALREAVDLMAAVAVSSGAAANPASGEYLALFRKLAGALDAASGFATALRDAPAQGEVPEAVRQRLAADAVPLQSAAQALRMLWLVDAGEGLGLAAAVASFETTGAGEPAMLAAMLAERPLTADTVARLRRHQAGFAEALAVLGGAAASAATARLEARIAGLETRAMLVISAVVFSLCVGAAFAVSQGHALAAERERIDSLRTAALEALRQAEGLMALHAEPPPATAATAVNDIVTAA